MFALIVECYYDINMITEAREQALNFLINLPLAEFKPMADCCGISVHTLLAFRYQRHKDQRWQTIEAVLKYKESKEAAA